MLELLEDYIRNSLIEMQHRSILLCLNSSVGECCPTKSEYQGSIPSIIILPTVTF